MITNNYLFSTQFLGYLKNQKIKDEENFNSFVAIIRGYLSSQRICNNTELENLIESVVEQLQFCKLV
jgi:hypothetical protein